MKKYYLLIFVLFGCIYAWCQEQAYSVNWTTAQADSVKRELRLSTNDTLRMKMARSLCIHYQEINRDTSLLYANLQMSLAKKLKQQFWEADAYDNAGWLSAELKNYPLSLEYLLTAIRMMEDKDIEKNIWQLSIFSPNLDAAYARSTALGFVYNDISQLYEETGDTEKESLYIRKGIAIANQISNNVLLGLLKANLANLKLKINQPDSVIYFGKQALLHMKNSGYKTYEGYQLTLMGDAYIQKGQFDTAKYYLDQSVIANQANGTIVKLPDAYFSYSTLHELQGNPDSSIIYLNKAIAAFSYFNLPDKVSQSYGLLYLRYKEKNQPDSAYHYLQLYQSLSDSLNEKEKRKIHAYQNIAFNKQIEQQQLESQRVEKANSNRTYAFLAGIAVLVLVSFLLLRNNQTRRKANGLLQKQKAEIEEQKMQVEKTLVELKITQAQLIQSEKMASLGELTAGIAHEIQNPLNFVNNFSEVNKELLAELNEEIEKGNYEEVKIIANDVIANEEKINHHGKRADAIVKGMLQHSRSTNNATKEPTNINALADEYLRLAYHGLRAKDKSFNATMKTDYDETIGNINIVPQDIGRVILNLITNAFYAVALPAPEKIGTGNGGGLNPGYKHSPTVWVSTKKFGDKVLISVRDNGPGIPKKILDKIFQPFFTTKPTGQGTGLGLSLAYDIVKAHGGELRVETKEGEGSEFIIQLTV